MNWDTLVIGSGIGGLTAAAALAREGQRVLVLEQHDILGGMTQTFARQGFSFGTGLHYLTGVTAPGDDEARFARLLNTLGDGTLRFQPLPDRFDLVRLIHPDGTETRFAYGAPEADNWARLKAQFPAEGAAIDAYADQYEQARRSINTMMALHGVPRPAATLMRWVLGRRLQRRADVTLAEALAHVRDPQLRAILAARGGDYGLPPSHAPLVLHALVMGSYAEGGAGYPIGGPARLAESLRPACGTRVASCALARAWRSCWSRTAAPLACGWPMAAKNARPTSSPPWARSTPSPRCPMAWRPIGAPASAGTNPAAPT